MSLTSAQQVRLLVGDPEGDDQVLSDEEVDHFVDDRSYVDAGGTVINIPAAAADAAGALAAHYAAEFNFAEDGQRFDLSQRHSHYLALEQSLRSRQGVTAVPLAGTTST